MSDKRKQLADNAYLLYKDSNQRAKELSDRITELCKRFHKVQNTNERQEIYEQVVQAEREQAYEEKRSGELAHDIVRYLYGEKEDKL